MLRGIYSAIYGEINVSVSVGVELKGDYIEKEQNCSISVTLQSWSGRKILDPFSYVSTPLLPGTKPSTHCTGGRVGLRAGLDG